MKKTLWLISIVICLFCYFNIHEAVWDKQSELRRGAPAGYTLPSQFSRILAVGNKVLLADFLFLKTMTFLGERIGEDQVPSDEDWRFVIQSLDAVTDLDPYFLDPYVFAQATLAWDAHMPEEAIRLLEKGFQNKPEHWRLAFYAGFDAFYFLNDFSRAADFVSKASNVSGSYSFLPHLAARLYYYGGESRIATVFLKDMLISTTESRTKAKLSKRLEALESAAILEELILKYQNESGRKVVKLDELITAGYLISMPVDPYGGEWFIAKNGRVFSTSKFVDKRSVND